jgi:Helix-hairpin-helix domain
MTSDLTSASAATPAAADDLTRIRGIGPAIARRLHSAGVTTFDQLAARSPAELAAFIGVVGLSAAQVVRKDWVGQAQALAAERAPIIPADELFDTQLIAPADESATLAARQHYATFMIELLLDEENRVRRTRAAHVQGGAEESWAGWRAPQLLAFFTQHAEIQAAPAEPARATPEPAPSIQDAYRGAAIYIRGLDLTLVGEDGAQSFLCDDQPFEVRLAIAFSEMTLAAGEPWFYDATIYAKSLGSHTRCVVGQAHGTLPGSDPALLRLAGARLARGIYRLEAIVSAKPAPGATGATDALTAFREGGLVHVY